MQQIYWRTPIPKCDFNKVAKQLCWNHTSAWVFSCKFPKHFRNMFSSEHLWTAASDRCFKLLKISQRSQEKVAGLRVKKRLFEKTPVQIFSCEFCEIFQNSFFIEQLWQNYHYYSRYHDLWFRGNSFDFFSYFHLKVQSCKYIITNIWLLQHQ